MNKLIDQHGKVQYGISATPYDEINYRDFAEPFAMGKLPSHFAKRMAYKHFQYFGVISPELLMGCALVELAHSAVLFCYVFEPASQKLHEFQFSDYGRLATKCSTSPTTGSCVFKRGQTRIAYINNMRDGVRHKRLCVNIGSRLQADICFSEADFEPMCITTRAGAGGFVYAQKAAGIGCSGTLKLGAREFKLEPNSAFAHHDWSGGFMRRHTFWNWACLSGAVDNVPIGLNLSCGVNETSFTENCYWLAGKLHKVDSVNFEFDRQKPISTWHIQSFDGQINLYFEPLGIHREYRQLIIAKSNFKQLFGYFHGNIGSIKIDKIYGFVEDQYALW